jgi:hypothetical protein
MVTIIDKNTGLVLFGTTEPISLRENEMVIDAICDLEFNSETQSQYYNFITNAFEIREKNINQI